MDDNYNKRSKRRNKFAGKEDISRETVDSILFSQIDQLREISRVNDETAAQVSENIKTLYEKRISIDTEKFEQLNLNFINEMQNNIRKVKQPSRGLKWYIVMWVITLASAFLSGYFIHEYREYKEKALYWHERYEERQLGKI